MRRRGKRDQLSIHRYKTYQRVTNLQPTLDPLWLIPRVCALHEQSTPAESSIKISKIQI